MDGNQLEPLRRKRNETMIPCFEDRRCADELTFPNRLARLHDSNLFRILPSACAHQNYQHLDYRLLIPPLYRNSFSTAAPLDLADNSALRNKLPSMSLTNCRFYEEKYPEIDSFVMVNVKQVRIAFRMEHERC